jgi:glycosyltransferase involved in cell wall biosynthesis
VSVSLCITVLNERHNIQALVESIQRQTQMPDQTIIVDGGSTDGTIEYLLLHSWISLKVDRKCNLAYSNSPVARGRNVAIDIAEGEYILVTDAGCKLDSRYVEEMSKDLSRHDVVGGLTVVEQNNEIQRIASMFLGVGHKEMRSVLNVPSRAIGFRKSIWEKVGGYPEIALTAEDTAFNERLFRYGVDYRFNDSAIVHWQPPSTARGLLRQVYRYAKGDGICGTGKKQYIAKFIKYGIIL